MGKLEGVTPLRGIIGEAVNTLGRRIAAGEWAPNETITKEPALIDELGISRSVLREAMRVLGAKGMIESKTSVGTTVRSRNNWRLLDPDVISWRISAGETKSLLDDLLRLRLVLEPGVAALAAQMGSDQSFERIAAAWDAKVRVFEDEDMPDSQRRQEFILTDLEFHKALIAATESELLDQLFGVVEAALSMLLDLQMKARGYKRKMIGMDQSHEMHEEVYLAVMERSPDRARLAMQHLIEFAIGDALEGFSLLEKE